MIHSKEGLEKEINESPYFTISGDSMEAAKESAKGKLVLNIWNYCRYYWYPSLEKSMRTFEECDDKIFKCIYDCLKKFDPNKDVFFIHYLKRSISHLVHEFQMDEASKFYNEPDHIIKDSDGKKHDNIYETTQSHYEESDALLFDDTEKLLRSIEIQFIRRLDKTKPYLQKLLTLKLFDALVKIPNLNQNYSFIDYDMLKKYTSVEDTPSQKDIAAAFDKLESDASRTLRVFFNKIQENIQKL
ncbi:hypothetical protein [Treponema primitia]|uniref:hypothetical protein n=1 Tax=Treponema primitia TaxID=88058 RepID=UPI0002554E46|nr:hypothetical protein [Treponema primitia]